MYKQIMLMKSMLTIGEKHSVSEQIRFYMLHVVDITIKEEFALQI